MEKSFAVDAPGIRRVLKAGEKAAAEEPQDRRRPDEPPLASRRKKPSQQIHDGLIGKVITLWAYRVHGPAGWAARRADQ